MLCRDWEVLTYCMSVRMEMIGETGPGRIRHGARVRRGGLCNKWCRRADGVCWSVLVAACRLVSTRLVASSRAVHMHGGGLCVGRYRHTTGRRRSHTQKHTRERRLDATEPCKPGHDKGRAAEDCEGEGLGDRQAAVPLSRWRRAAQRLSSRGPRTPPIPPTHHCPQPTAASAT